MLSHQHCKNHEQYLEYYRNYRIKNRVKIRASRNRWGAENKDKVKANSLKWRENNLEKSNELARQYRKLHPEVGQVNWHRRRKALAKAGGAFSKEQWEQLKEIYGWLCPMCIQKKPLTIDHKIPVSKGGTNYIDNIQPLCKSCNSKKARDIWFANCPLKLAA